MFLFKNHKIRLAIVALMTAVVGLLPATGHADTRSRVGTEATGADDWYLYVLEEGTYNKWHEKEVFKTEGEELPKGCYSEFDTEGNVHYYIHEYEKDESGNVIDYPCYKVVKAIKGLHKEDDTSSYTFGSLEMTNTQFFCIKNGAAVSQFEREGVTPTKFKVQEAETSLIQDPAGISDNIVTNGKVYYCGKKYADDHVALPYSTLVFKPGQIPKACFT